VCCPRKINWNKKNWNRETPCRRPVTLLLQGLKELIKQELLCRAGVNGFFGEDILQPPMKYYFNGKVRYTSIAK